MVKWSWVLVTSTHVIYLLKCASVVWAAWLVPITPCSNQSAQTAITRGWNGCAGLKMVKEPKGRRWEWQNLTSQCNHTWTLVLLETTALNCFRREWNIYTCRAAQLDRISRFAQKINYGLSWKKMQPFMSPNYTSSVLLVQKCHYPAHLSHCKRQKSDEGHDHSIIRPTVLHPVQQQSNILCPIGVVKCLLCKTGIQMLQSAPLWHQRVSDRGFRMDFLCCAHAGKLALLSKQTRAGKPSQRSAPSDTERRHGHIKRGSVLSLEDHKDV